LQRSAVAFALGIATELARVVPADVEVRQQAGLGLMIYNQEATEAREKGLLYIGVIKPRVSHSSAAQENDDATD
jgi:hypothetical protein